MTRRLVLLAALLTMMAGCGGDVNDASRVPAGATDTSDPSKVNLQAPPTGLPQGAVPGPPGAAAK